MEGYGGMTFLAGAAAGALDEADFESALTSF